MIRYLISDIKNPKLIYLKGFLFLMILIISAIEIVLETKSWKIVILLLLVIWSSARIYYFMFYVIEKYLDSNYKFSGIMSFVRYSISVQRSPRFILDVQDKSWTPSLRRYKEGDEEELWSLFYNTVHKVNIQHYSPEQIVAWAPDHVDQKKWKEWKERLKRTKPFVVESNGQILGFAELENNGHIDCFYTHHEWQNKGVGNLLMGAIKAEAEQRHFTKLYTEASITAKPFFLNHGFVVEKEQLVSVRGVEFKNYAMLISLQRINAIKLRNKLFINKRLYRRLG